MYVYARHVGYMPVYSAGDAHHYDPASMSFMKKTSKGTLHVRFIKQDDPVADQVRSALILDKAQGFTSPRVRRLNDSIRTYVWAILDAQVQTRTGILGSRRAIDACRQFLTIVNCRGCHAII